MGGPVLEKLESASLPFPPLILGYARHQMFQDGGDDRQAILGAPRVDSTPPKSSTMPWRTAAAASGGTGAGGNEEAADAQVARSVSLSISMAGRWDEEGGGGGGGGSAQKGTGGGGSGGGKLSIRKRFTLKVRGWLLVGVLRVTLWRVPMGWITAQTGIRHRWTGRVYPS